jgi:hypothetical protein
VTLEAGATALFEIGGAGSGEYDRLIISAASGSGTLTLGGTLELVSYNNYAGAEGDEFRLFDLVSGATVTGEFEGGINGFALGEGLAWDYTALYTNGVVSIVAGAVPEPAAWAALAGLAILVLAALRPCRV